MAEETQFKDFLRAKERGELKVRIVHALSANRGSWRARTYIFLSGRGHQPPIQTKVYARHVMLTCTRVCMYVRLYANVCVCVYEFVHPKQIDKFTRRTSTALQSVELVQAEGDEYVHFGDVLQVCNRVETHAVHCRQSVVLYFMLLHALYMRHSSMAYEPKMLTPPPTQNSLLLLFPSASVNGVAHCVYVCFFSVSFDISFVCAFCR